MVKLLHFKSAEEYDDIFLERVKKRIKEDPEMIAEILHVLWTEIRDYERGTYDNLEPLEVRLGEAYYWASQWSGEIED